MSGLHSWSMGVGVGLGGGVQRTASGRVRQRPNLWTRRSEDEGGNSKEAQLA